MTNYTAKAKEMKIQAFAITGRRWFRKSYGGTYNTATVAALIDGTWQDLGKTAQAYGYGECYVKNGVDLLKQMGLLSRNASDLRSSREKNRIECHVYDVKRERDL